MQLSETAGQQASNSHSPMKIIIDLMKILLRRFACQPLSLHNLSTRGDETIKINSARP